MTAILLALAAACCFGAMPVAVRFALRGGAPPAVGTLVMQGAALALVLHGAWIEGGLGLEGTLPFLLAGLIAPGASQIFITLGIRDAGSSRASVAFGTAPVFAVAIAVATLDERPGVAVLLGALLVVGGGVALAVERDRPAHVRRLGIAYAVLGAVLFAIRDNLVRHLSLDTDVPALTGAAATLASAFAFTAVVAVVRRERPGTAAGLAGWIAPGILVGLAYVALFEAFYRGAVSVVAPIVGTESLFGVLFSAALLRRSEGITARVAAGGLLVVAGGVVIGVFR